MRNRGQRERLAMETQSEQSSAEKCDTCTFSCFRTRKSLKAQTPDHENA